MAKKIKYNGNWRDVNTLWIKTNVQDATTITNTETITSNQNFTIPSNVINLTIRVYGAGGGGGGLTENVKSGATNYPATGGPTPTNPDFGTSRAFGLSAYGGTGGGVDEIGVVGEGGGFSDEFGWNSFGVTVSGSDGSPGTQGKDGIPGTSTPPIPPSGGNSGGNTPSGGTGGNNDVVNNTGSLTHFFDNNTNQNILIDGTGASFTPQALNAEDELTCEIMYYSIASIISGDGVTSSTEITVTLSQQVFEGLYVGAPITVFGVPNSGYNGTYIISKVLSTTKFVYTVLTAPSVPSRGPGGLIQAGQLNIFQKHYLVQWFNQFPNNDYIPVLTNLNSRTAGGLFDPNMSLCHFGYFEQGSFRVQFKRSANYTTFTRGFAVSATWIGQRNAGGGGGGYIEATITKQQLIDSGIYTPGTTHQIRCGENGIGGGKGIPEVTPGIDGISGFVELIWTTPTEDTTLEWKQVESLYVKSNGQWEQV